MDRYRPLGAPAQGLPDQRLRTRLHGLIDTFARQPACTIPHATADRNHMDATYEFFKNPRVHPEGIVASCLAHTRSHLHGCSRVLAIQDSSEANYDTLTHTSGLGYTDGSHTRGLKFHSTLAVRADGGIAGLLTQQVWARPFADKGRAASRRQRAAADKESFRWRDHAHAARRALPDDVVVVHIADREGDIYDWFAAPRPAHTHLLVRVAQPQRVVVHGEGRRGHLGEVVAAAAVLGTHSVNVPRADDRPSRVAGLSLRVAEVALQPPQHATGEGPWAEVPVWVIEAREECPPEGQSAIHWRLVTTEPMRTTGQVVQALREYLLRWLIERFHFVLKSGLRVEQLELASADRLGNALAVYSQAAVRILRLTHLGRVAPEAPAAAEFTADELAVLDAESRRRTRGSAGPLRTVAEAVRVVGQLGGHLGRRGDGPPGVKVLWRGLLALHHRVLGLRVGQSRPDPQNDTRNA